MHFASWDAWEGLVAEATVSGYREDVLQGAHMAEAADECYLQRKASHSSRSDQNTKLKELK